MPFSDLVSGCIVNKAQGHHLYLVLDFLLTMLIEIGAKPLQAFTSATCLTKCLAQVTEVEEDTTTQSTDPVQVFRKWGCNYDDLDRIFKRNPQLREADITLLQSNLSVLSHLGLEAPDLVRIINCRPRFLLSSRVHRYFDERFPYIDSLFESKKLLKRAVVTNPSLLFYDFNKTIRPALAQYQELGVDKEDFLSLIFLEIPHLLLINLDTLMKPRVLLMRKLQDMDGELEFTPSSIIRAVRMEHRFVQLFIASQPKQIADELMEFYKKAKEFKSLPGLRKKFVRKGFPF
ncbi:hypothetical protein K1719_012740 [Acacia pycnantha]|nr:hypothetical protein K1719_012740 [Acacia pycnantha]